MKSSKEKRALIAGMIGCLLYVIGDFLFAATGKSQSTESIGLMVKVAYRYRDLVHRGGTFLRSKGLGSDRPCCG